MTSLLSRGFTSRQNRCGSRGQREVKVDVKIEVKVEVISVVKIDVKIEIKVEVLSLVK